MKFGISYSLVQKGLTGRSVGYPIVNKKSVWYIWVAQKLSYQHTAIYLRMGITFNDFETKTNVTSTKKTCNNNGCTKFGEWTRFGKLSRIV